MWMKNSVDPDQLASSSGSTQFSKKSIEPNALIRSNTIHGL